MNEKDLFQVSEYAPSKVKCYAFQHGSDVKDGIQLALGNMVSGYPFFINGIEFNNSESAYISGLYGCNTQEHITIQRKLTIENNGLFAKREYRGKKYKHLQREDWESWNVAWMKYVVWCKAATNKDFANLLCSLGLDSIIIEDTSQFKNKKSEFWGAKNKQLKQLLDNERDSKQLNKKQLTELRLDKYSDVGVFHGCNVMGKILTEVKNALLTNSEPSINYSLLKSKEIYLMGELLTFDTPLTAVSQLHPQPNKIETPMPKQQPKKEHLKQRVMKSDKFIRYTTIMRESNIEKIKAIATSKGITQKDLLDVILTDYISRYEMKYGEVRKRKFDPSELLV